MSALSALEAFFERRVDPRPIALARVVVGCAALLRAYVSYRYIEYVLRSNAVRAPIVDGVPLLTLDWLPYYCGVWVVAACAFIVGFQTRTAGAVLTALLGYHLIADQNLFFNHIHFLMLIVFLLTVAGAGATWSADWLLAGRPRRTVALWAITLGKLQISIVYFYTALAKINPHFLSGKLLTGSLQHLPQVLKTPAVMEALSYGVVAGEMFLAFGMWFPRTRIPALLTGVAMHVVIPILIHPYMVLIVFSTAAIGAYGFFLRGEDLDWIRQKIQLPGQFLVDTTY